MGENERGKRERTRIRSLDRGIKLTDKQGWIARNRDCATRERVRTKGKEQLLEIAGRQLLGQ